MYDYELALHYVYCHEAEKIRVLRLGVLAHVTGIILHWFNALTGYIAACRKQRCTVILCTLYVAR